MLDWRHLDIKDSKLFLVNIEINAVPISVPISPSDYLVLLCLILSMFLVMFVCL